MGLLQMSMEVARHQTRVTGRAAKRTTAPPEAAPVDAAPAEAHARRLAQLVNASRSWSAGSGRMAPHMHVAGYARRPALDARPLSAEVATDAGRTLDVLRWSMTVAGALVILVSLLLAANREALTLLVLRKGRPSRSKCQPRFVLGEVFDPADIAIGHSYEFVDEGEAPGAFSVWDGTVAAFSCIVGTGLLAMPYAFSLAGMGATVLVVFFVGCSLYTGHLLSWSMHQLGTFSLGSLVEEAFGSRARRATNAFLVVELWGYMLSSLVCGSLNVAQLGEGIDTRIAVALCTISVYFMSFLPSRVMTRVNVLANLSFIVCCAMFVFTGLRLPERPPPTDLQVVKPHGLIAAAGILVFSPAAHSFYPALMGKMADPAAFPICLRRAYGAACVLYLAVAVSGYYLFGNRVQPSAVMNIGVDLSLSPLPDLGWMNPVAAFGMCIKMLALATLVLSSLTSTIESSLSGGLGKGEGDGLRAAITPGVLAISAVVATRFAHEMASLLNLIGSVFCMNIAFVIPVMCFWRLSPEPLGWARRAGFVALITMGVTFAVLGFCSAV